jgi:membrane-associated phospholipid phosphatase
LLDPPSFRRALAHAAGLSIFFLVVYGSINHFTSLRPDVGVFVFEWERHIPFVPIFIIPYLSIDLFFVAAPFLCTTRGELSILSRRILLAITIAAACFLLFPLRFSFERPPAPGWLGVVFDWFRAMDKPFNQFPSLHIALRTILAEHYARHTRGALRWANHIWFSLIGASTLLVYQHHVIDIAGGFVLGWACFYLVGEARWRLPFERSYRIGMYYLVGSAVVLAAARLGWPWSAPLLWPGMALLVVAGAYLWLGPGVYRRTLGRSSPAARLLLAPVTAGQWLSHRHYARRSPAWSEITDRLWIGRTLSDAEARRACAQGVGAVLDLTVELPENATFRAMEHYRHLPILDLTAPRAEQVEEAIRFIDAHAGTIVYVHCKAGYSRSAAVAGAWLVRSGRCGDADEAMALLRERRPHIVIRPEAEAVIRAACAT